MGELAQLITSLATLVAACGAVVMSWRNSRKIEAVHIATNSLTDRLVATTRSDATQAGIAEGRKIEKESSL